jgi:hypothetical protein
MSILKKDIDAFEAVVSEQFSFLVTDFDMRYAGTSSVEDDPRDSYVVAKYRKDELRVDVAWNPFAMSLGVLLRVCNDELGRRERYVYLEPFIEFATNGRTPPVVPQIYPNMSVGKIEKAMNCREQLFAGGVERPLSEIAVKLKEQLDSIRNASAETIREYQSWYQSRGKAA